MATDHRVNGEDERTAHERAESSTIFTREEVFTLLRMKEREVQRADVVKVREKLREDGCNYCPDCNGTDYITDVIDPDRKKD